MVKSLFEEEFADNENVLRMVEVFNQMKLKVSSRSRIK